jgi:hypothetical protein
MENLQQRASERVVLERIVSLRTDEPRFPELIYLIDLGGETVWCEDPDPHQGIDNCDVVEYRKAGRNDFDFKHGILYSAAQIINMHDDPVCAADLLRESGYADEDCSFLEEYDKEALRKLIGERGINLKGL